MFAEEARWLRAALSGLPIGEGTTVLDIGSQSLEFRTAAQPYIDREIFAPIRALGARVTHLDAQPAEGVDIVADITAEDFTVGGHPRFDLVICTNLLEHVRDRPRAIQRLDAVTAGRLVVTVPGHFPYHEDPIDTMYRPTPRRLAADVTAVAGGLTPVLTKSIHILDRSWYLSALSRCRRFVPPLRWRTSAVIFENRAAAA